MIRLERVNYGYPGAGENRQGLLAALSDVTLEIKEGELVLVIGPSGAGKSTFLRCLNGLVPHFYGGVLRGQIRVAGQDPVALGPQRMSGLVGMVFQDPESQFVTDRVEDELAFGLENRALPPALMRKRVEEVLDQLTIAHLRGRYLSTLSGGEKQRVAIAAVMTTHPQVLVLDEPTSQLDPQSAEEVLVAIRRLNEDLGLTVVLAEHRLERVVQFVDRVLYLPGDGNPPLLDTPQTVMAQVPLAPPLAALGKQMGWQPLPLTVKQARRFVRGFNPDASIPELQDTGDDQPASSSEISRRSLAGMGRFLAGSLAAELATLRDAADPTGEKSGPPALLRVEDLWYRYDNGQEALRGVDLTLHAGEVVALMGRNGSGKSTLLKHLVGLLKPAQGRVIIQPGPAAGSQPEAPAAGASGTRARLLKRLEAGTGDLSATRAVVQAVGYVPQNPDALLFKDTVLEELAFTRRGHGFPADPAADRALLARLGLAGQAGRYPRDLSSGQRQRVALAAILVADPRILLLDEPTRGLDYEQKEALTAILQALRAEGRAVLLATHDVELVARCADRVVLMGDGEVIVDGPTRQVMTGSLVFASQVNKLFRDPRFLVVEDCLQSL